MNNETRRAMLWLTNDEGFYRNTVETIEHCAKDALDMGEDPLESAMDGAFRAVETAIEDAYGTEGMSPMAAEAVDVFVSAINADEIAEYYREDCERIAEGLS